MPQWVRSSEWSGGTLATRNFDSEPPKVLFVCCGNKVCQRFVLLCGVEGLAPQNLGTLAMRYKFEGENKVVAIEVFYLKELILNDA